MSKDKKVCNGVGELILKNGARDEVTWEVKLESLPAHGVLRGKKKHLNAAAKDGFAILHLGKGRAAAIAIDRHKDGKAFFTSLLESTPTIFFAEKILFSSPRSDGTKYGIEFSNGKGQTLQVIVPSANIWDLLPQAFDDLKQFFVPQAVLLDYQPVQTIVTGIDCNYPLVFVGFNGDQPYAIGSELARQTAGELYELAAKIEGGPTTIN
jgi:hypothetical protein